MLEVFQQGLSVSIWLSGLLLGLLTISLLVMGAKTLFVSCVRRGRHILPFIGFLLQSKKIKPTYIKRKKE